MHILLVFYAKMHYTTYVMFSNIIQLDIPQSVKNVFSMFSMLSPFKLFTSSIEILIIAFIIYKILMWIKNTRAWILLRGLIVILVCVLIAYICKFEVILEILKRVSYVTAFGLIIIFQDDLRAGLEHLGRQKVFSKLLPNINKFTKKISKDSIREIAEASFAMGAVKTGALIVIEQEFTLEEYERTGIDINGDVTRQLLINIFEKNTPLHDGAVLIVGDVIKSATCYLPLSHNNDIPKDLGTRHRAALGMSEVSDAIIIVVSEETGRVSVCRNGELKVMNDEREMARDLIELIYGHEENENVKLSTAETIRSWFK